jgi:proteasome beta subunit
MLGNDPVDRMVLKGTTTAGVVCKDGVILASDTRVTMGFYVAHKHGKKVYKIADHLGMTIAGTVADAQWLLQQGSLRIFCFQLDMYRYRRRFLLAE